ncbi:hypothetical protein DFP72DRAFT_844402 [Ephemerocybe angulata]|uniref:Uncharacterized protein n=1 Tax=Ephemerocybe angulata TaxID=980116 RepID=A0A8H6M7W0_9AGAR|nr:hypothetical protein DFP72DRAFT_844402 [Tulosesus angulatus]
MEEGVDLDGNVAARADWSMSDKKGSINPGICSKVYDRVRANDVEGALEAFDRKAVDKAVAQRFKTLRTKYNDQNNPQRAEKRRVLLQRARRFQRKLIKQKRREERLPTFITSYGGNADALMPYIRRECMSSEESEDEQEVQTASRSFVVTPKKYLHPKIAKLYLALDKMASSVNTQNVARKRLSIRDAPEKDPPTTNERAKTRRPAIGAAEITKTLSKVKGCVSECGARRGLRLRACSSASGSAPRYALPDSQASRALTGDCCQRWSPP